jgi:glutathione synthase/RimK-type ligase-like ATP-grasp enzyme
LDREGAAGRIEARGLTTRLDEIASVWYRRPAEPEPPEEVEDPDDRRFVAEESEEALFGLWRVLDCTWVSHPDALNAASYKPAQLLMASRLGFEVPRTLITNEPREAAAFVGGLGGSAVIKPLRFGVVKETDEYEDVVFTSPLREADVTTGMEAVSLCPCLLQEYVPKDVEVRATVVGKEVFAAEIHSQVTSEAEHDWRRAPATEVPHFPHELTASVADRCVRLVE